MKEVPARLSRVHREPVKSFYMNNLDGWAPVSKDEIVVCPD